MRSARAGWASTSSAPSRPPVPCSPSCCSRAVARRPTPSDGPSCPQDNASVDSAQASSASPPLGAAQGLEPPAILLGRPGAEVRAERERKTPLEGALLSARHRFGGLLVERLRDGGRPAPLRDRDDDDLAPRASDRHLDGVARPDVLCRLHPG